MSESNLSEYIKLCLLSGVADRDTNKTRRKENKEHVCRSTNASNPKLFC